MGETLPPRSAREERRDGLASFDALFRLHSLEIVPSPWEDETMTPPTDSLENELRAVPLRGMPSTTLPPIAGNIPATEWVVDYSALAAKAREWVRANLPLPFLGHPGCAAPGAESYNVALADVVRRLGL